MVVMMAGRIVGDRQPDWAPSARSAGGPTKPAWARSPPWSRASPAHPDRTLAESMRSIFSGAIGGPWCFMEFGDVGWCKTQAPGPATGRGGAARSRPRNRPRSAARARNCCDGARTNGELFLALPANEAARNSINESGSLFNALCGGSEEPCHGPTASEAEFRNQSGTLWRGHRACVCSGSASLGMLLLLGFIALRLLTRRCSSLFFLLLAPAAVIAPALGDGGRAAFRAWATRLLGAIVLEADLLVPAGCRAADAADAAGASTRLAGPRSGCSSRRCGGGCISNVTSVHGFAKAASRAPPARTPLAAAAGCANGLSNHPRWCAPGNGSKTSCARRRRAWSAGANWRRRASNGLRG